jgi:hypothetical protein
MNPLQRSSLGLEIDQVLATADTVPSLFAGHDLAGRSYLVAQARRDEHSVTWLCAPISVLALRCVAEGRADPSDALRHSATGTVDRITVSIAELPQISESVQFCRDLGEEDLAGADLAGSTLLLRGARCA